MQKVNEEPSITLQTVISQFRDISPEITRAFVFKKDGEILASIEDDVGEDQAKKIAASFDEVANYADVIGGVEALTIQGVSSQLEVSSANNCYLATAASRAANERMIKALTRVIIPTVVKLLDQAGLSADNSWSDDEKQVDSTAEENAESSENDMQRMLPLSQSPEQVFPKPPVNQFMVEKISGLLVAPDIVRVNTEVVAKWNDMFGGKEITQVNVETLEGKAAVCRFKPMKEADGKAKGIIQIPERIMHALETGEGKLVVVKPLVPK